MDTAKAEVIANRLIREHLSSEWSFKWNNRKRAFGVCSYRTKTIQLSKPITTHEGEKKITDTILHEIAHAIAGHDAGHGAEWKRVARRLGASPTATGVITFDQAKLEPKWVVVFGQEIVHSFHKRPSPKTFRTIHMAYIQGRKAETKGKLNLVSYESFKKNAHLQ